MRKTYYNFTMRTLMGNYAKLLYEMSPGNMPFRADDMMAEARNAFQSVMVHASYRDLLIIERNTKTMLNYFLKLFADKPGFRLLNYTKNLMRTKFTDAELAEKSLEDIYEVMKGVNNEYIRITDRYTKDSSTQDEYDNDFIDLDAFMSNFVCALHDTSISDDCFLCKRDRTGSAFCSKCNVNPVFGNYYKCTESASGPETTVCETGCPKGLKICCKDCKTSETYKDTLAKDCPYACDDTPDTCNNWRFIGKTENPDMIKKDQEEENAFRKKLEDIDHVAKKLRRERQLDECSDSVPVQPQDR